MNRFLKDPMLFASSMFLENEDRIVAMVMVMGLALMVYSLAEHKLRKHWRRKTRQYLIRGRSQR